MYQTYPEWGPSRHRRDESVTGGDRAVSTGSRSADRPTGQVGVQAALDLRDRGGQRPDDN